MVSMKDISAVCGVSVATVSKALNNQNDIGQETKRRIRQTAEEMGYFPNTAAKMLKTNRSYNIGVLFSHEDYSGLTHDYYAFVLDSLKNTVEEVFMCLWNLFQTLTGIPRIVCMNCI